ncbi:peptidyl-tRNA hydrolase 2, mitochondrial isoform X2 [Capsicum annuum]|uniref:peptidyl-tRNA hydrolase 2, mitochondrial isoform X2 n=1 Tax=Capsicum annuum TaxID=4072 RepID=UPI0007BEE48A|nr:peptidyl-tRNA hydrolase 2, mitochondrial isoform X2 [Capsicum annuum]
MRIFDSTFPSSKKEKEEKEWLGSSFKPENFIPGIVIGFIIGLLMDLSKHSKSSNSLKKTSNLLNRNQPEKILAPSKADEELKMRAFPLSCIRGFVLVVRQDLKMAQGKVASQCAHAATGMYADLMQSDQYLLRQWEQCGQPKIVVTCKNQQEMNKLKEAAENIGLPTFVVADAGRTQSSEHAYVFWNFYDAGRIRL